jgi:hypothetical protein
MSAPNLDTRTGCPDTNRLQAPCALFGTKTPHSRAPRAVTPLDGLAVSPMRNRTMTQLRERRLNSPDRHPVVLQPRHELESEIYITCASADHRAVHSSNEQRQSAPRVSP